MPSISLPKLAGISLATSAAGAGIGAIGAMQSSSAQSANAQYQAQVARNNQIVAEQNAQLAIQTGEAKATTRSLQGAAALGRVKAAQSTNNAFDVNTGTAVNVRSSEREMNQLDTMTVMNTAQLE